MRYQEIAERKRKRKKRSNKQLRVGGWYGFTGSAEGEGGGVEESKYLGATEKVDSVGPVLGSKPKKQKKLMNKFFGSS